MISLSVCFRLFVSVCLSVSFMSLLCLSVCFCRRLSLPVQSQSHFTRLKVYFVCLLSVCNYVSLPICHFCLPASFFPFFLVVMQFQFLYMFYLFKSFLFDLVALSLSLSLSTHIQTVVEEYDSQGVQYQYSSATHTLLTQNNHSFTISSPDSYLDVPNM